MDRAELRDRLRQESAKRQDGLLSRLGHGFGQDLRSATPVEAGKFFFNADSIASILALLRQRIPGWAEEVVSRADGICRLRFDLLGYENLDYGDSIDWHLDAVHGKRAPRKPFHKVRYLDFAEVGDSKVTWELNRHQHFVTLAKACRLTGDSRYEDEILQQWRHWVADNPYPVGINWASSLEVSFRCLSWIWTYELLRGWPGLIDFRDEWLRGLALHGRHIERYLSTYFSPNTHLLGEGVGLFFLGVMCPELAAAERWKALGWEIVVREAERQVQADGFHFEQSTYYHVYALDFFLHSAILASANNIAIPRSFEDALQRMLTALCLLGRNGCRRGSAMTTGEGFSTLGGIAASIFWIRWLPGRFSLTVVTASSRRGICARKLSGCWEWKERANGTICKRCLRTWIRPHCLRRDSTCSRHRNRRRNSWCTPVRKGRRVAATAMPTL